jgi:hypothetical protein
MSLLQFDKTVVLSECGKIYLEAYNPAFDDWDATAQCNVSLSDIKNMFAFQSDHFDVDDVSASDLRFYVDNVKIPNLDLSNNIVYDGAVIDVNQSGATLVGSDMLVQKDYVRHLAQQLFNTAYGVDLFINEEALVNSVKAALQTAWNLCKEDLTNISIVGTNQELEGAAGNKYLLHDAEISGKSTFNIGRELFKMMVSRASSRFTDLEPLALASETDSAPRLRIDPNARNLYRLPFVVGDQLVMRVIIKPCPDQSSFQGVPGGDQDLAIRADERKYLLHLNLV